MNPWLSLHRLLWLLAAAFVATLATVWIVKHHGDPTDENKSRVVLYCAQDEEFAKEILELFRQQTGRQAVPNFDTEATKSVSLYVELVHERDRPRCDVFWNNEILSMIRLQRKGMLEPYASPSAKPLRPFPKSAQTDDHTWHAFGARARVLLVNTRLVKEQDRPKSLFDLTHERFRGQILMAKPQFGTSATQAACVFEVLGADMAKAYYRDLRKNGVQFAPGNKQAAEWVGEGKAAVCVTDTDDALDEVKAGHDVTIICPDRAGHPDYPRMGTLYIPNTVGIIRGCPEPKGARQLVDFLLSAEVEGRLAASDSHQIPFNPAVRDKLRKDVETPPAVKAMDVDFFAAADLWDEVQTFLRDEFARP